MLRLSILIIVLGGGASVAGAQPSRAENLLVSCSAPRASNSEHPCQWYLKGFLDGKGAEPGSIKISTICLPEDGFSVNQIRLVLVK